MSIEQSMQVCRINLNKTTFFFLVKRILTIFHLFHVGKIEINNGKNIMRFEAPWRTSEYI